MLKTKTVKIGTSIYSIKPKAELPKNTLGWIDNVSEEIHLRMVDGCNASLTKRSYFKVFIHEVLPK